MSEYLNTNVRRVMKGYLFIFCVFITLNNHCVQLSCDQLCTYVKERNLNAAKNFLMDGRSIINEPGSNGEPPLYWAAILGDSRTVELLLDYGANPNQLDKDDDTPLHSVAIFNNNTLVMELLLAYGAKDSINFIAHNGLTTAARKNGCRKV